ncbi:MAG: cation:proton antiporter [Armatimonadetes bacterium]|nr:cation:proton antiporter [Candidatus Hippobium faecium]
MRFFKRYPKLFLILLLLFTFVPKVFAAGEEVNIPHILIGIVIILLAAKIGGDIFVRLKQPAVLGELIFGILIGNAGIFGIDCFDFIKTDPGIEILSEVGVILLLFQVGLESNVKQMMKVGLSALLVATIGVVMPFILGYLVAVIFIKDEGVYAHMFIGATLCATSVGLTARVLMDLGKIATKEAQIILGAAVIDDVQGLIVLATITGLIEAVSKGTAMSAMGIIMIIVKAIVFLVLAVILGQLLSKYMFKFGSKLKSDNVMLAVGMILCFLFAYIANMIQLAPIVGAFAAGLVLDHIHYRDYDKFEEKNIEEIVEPIAGLLVPIFFVRMGASVDLSTFGNPSVLLLALCLTIAAILGKQACALAVLEKGVNRLTVGIGMIPRGEVGLIFAATGSALVLNGQQVINPNTYSAIIIMVIITTMITPPVLKAVISMNSGKEKTTQN